MSSEAGHDAVPRPTVRSVVGAPFSAQTYRNLVYLALAFPLGLLYFVLLSVGLSVGVGLALVVVGVPVVLGVLALALGLATFERKLTELLLGVDIPAHGPGPLSPNADLTPGDRLRGLVASTGTWKAVCYLGTKLVVGVAAFVTISSLLVTAATLLLVPFLYDQPHVTVGLVLDRPRTLHPAFAVGWNRLVVEIRPALELASWEVTTLPQALGVAAFGVVLAVVALNLLNALAWLSGWYARVMLGRPNAA